MDNFTDGPGFDKAASDADFIVLTISRREVESGNVSDVLDRLLNLSDNVAHVRKFEDSLALAFAGYDEDPRELHQVPEVVAFFRKLNSHWSYWIHFVEKDATNTVGMLFWLLCDVEVVTAGAGVVGFRFKEQESVSVQMRALFDSMNALYEANGIDEAHNEAMTAKFLEAFERGLA